MKNTSFCSIWLDIVFYDGNDDVKNNNGVNDHADNCDNQCRMYFTRLLTVLSVKYM